MPRIPSRALILCLSALLLHGCGEPESTAPGNRAPEISTLDLDDKAHRLSDYRGNVLVLNFWTGGCGPCIAEMPRFDAVYQEYQDDGLVILGINQGEEPAAVESTVRRLGIRYPIAIDQLGISTKRYRVSAVPATFVLDRDGVMRKKVIGELSREQLEAMVTPLLGLSESDLRAAEAEAEGEAEEANRLAGISREAGSAADGIKLYNARCRECHGRDRNEMAMGRSKPLSEVSSGEIYTILKRYQDRPATSPEMASKSGLSDQQISDLLAFFQHPTQAL